MNGLIERLERELEVLKRQVDKGRARYEQLVWDRRYDEALETGKLVQELAAAVEHLITSLEALGVARARLMRKRKAA